eukprot:TRINITY_DN9731_c0_g4_i2.p1 TRINITY_DN9731_c0_g4~~TRINITY_DN9731_c0_g4_i2.p1  ORF type:complete len:762 (+),score=102.79 TRINITY_DN9731_c0_g4_i2:118-2403(+)
MDTDALGVGHVSIESDIVEGTGGTGHNVGCLASCVAEKVCEGLAHTVSEAVNTTIAGCVRDLLQQLTHDHIQNLRADASLPTPALAPPRASFRGARCSVENHPRKTPPKVEPETHRSTIAASSEHRAFFSLLGGDSVNCAKTQPKPVCACGSVLAADSAFCNTCGTFRRPESSSADIKAPSTSGSSPQAKEGKKNGSRSWSRLKIRERRNSEFCGAPVQVEGGIARRRSLRCASSDVATAPCAGFAGAGVVSAQPRCPAGSNNFTPIVVPSESCIEEELTPSISSGKDSVINEIPAERQSRRSSDSFMQRVKSCTSSNSTPSGSNSRSPRMSGKVGVVSPELPLLPGAADAKDTDEQSVESREQEKGVWKSDSDMDSGARARRNFQNGPPRPTLKRLQEGLLTLPEICACGNLFGKEEFFCKQCGTKRPDLMLVTAIAMQIVESGKFEAFITVCICVNSLSIGLQANHSINNLHTGSPLTFVVADTMFFCIFSVEIALRVLAFGRTIFERPEWRWNLFDITLTTIQTVDYILSAVVDEDDEILNFSSNFSVARMMRVLRLLRIIRLFRLLRFVAELRTMVCSIASSFKSLFWTVVLLSLIVFIVGVYLTQLVADAGRARPTIFEEEESLAKYYNTLWRTFLSLFQATTGGVDWDDLLQPLAQNVSPWWTTIVLSGYIAFAVLAMMNIVTGVFVESALLSVKQDKELELVRQVRHVFLHWRFEIWQHPVAGFLFGDGRSWYAQVLQEPRHRYQRSSRIVHVA